MEEEKNNLKENTTNPYISAWWKPIIIFYTKTTSWIVLPLLVAILLGNYVGKTTGSQILFFLCVIIGFGITCFGIYREVKQYKKKIEKDNI